MNRACLEINLENLENNINEIKKTVGKKVGAVNEKIRTAEN